MYALEKMKSSITPLYYTQTHTPVIVLKQTIFFCPTAELHLNINFIVDAPLHICIHILYVHREEIDKRDESITFIGL